MTALRPSLPVACPSVCGRQHRTAFTAPAAPTLPASLHQGPLCRWRTSVTSCWWHAAPPTAAPGRCRWPAQTGAAEVGGGACQPGHATHAKCLPVLGRPACRHRHTLCLLSTHTTPFVPAGTSGWHTHALDYAVESLEPHCLFRVLRDGPRIALASLAADGHLLCASASGDRMALAACGSNGGGSAWVAAGASWEQRDGALCNSRWPEKASGAWAGAGGHGTVLKAAAVPRC